MSDSLSNLLHQTDQASPPSPGRTTLPHEIRALLAAQRARRRIKASAIAVLLAIAAIVYFNPFREHAQPLAKSPVLREVTKQELATLAIDAELHDRTANALIAQRKHVAAPQRPTPLDMRAERDRAALILVYEADQSAKKNHPAEAIAAYRRAVELFPRSHWADVARQRLKEMQT